MYVFLLNFVNELLMVLKGILYCNAFFNVVSIWAVLVLAIKNRLCMFILLIHHFYNGKIQVYHTAVFFSAVSMKARIFMTGSFSEIYVHHGVFNRGTNLVSV